MTEGAQRPGEPGTAGTEFDALFRREFAPIARTAYLVVGDWEVAREIAQDAFVQALRLEEGASVGEPGRLGAAGRHPRRGPYPRP